MTRALLLLMLLLLAPAAPAEAAKATKMPLVSGQYPHSALSADGYPYQLFVPRAATRSTGRHWPLMIFLD